MNAESKRPEMYEAEINGRKVRVTVPENEPEAGGAEDVADRIRKHPMYSPTDLAYLRRKGYGDQEILAFWDRDHAMGHGPLHHRLAYSGEAKDVLRDVLKDNLSPRAIAAIAACLQPARPTAGRTGDADVDRQVRWFADQLVELLGGAEAFERVCREIGL